MQEPEWLQIAREAAAIAQTGLAFARDPYDRQRYEQLRALASRMMAGHSAIPIDGFERALAAEAGYATPKVDVRGAAFDAEGRMLMVREASDQNRWTLPGGWADVNQTAAECVVREIEEESGYRARTLKLALVQDRARQGHHPAGPFSIYKLFFLCEITGGAPRQSIETTGTGFFADDRIPAELSTGRVLPHQIARLFAHRRDPALPTEFD